MRKRVFEIPPLMNTDTKQLKAVQAWSKRTELSKYLAGIEWDYFVTITAKHELTERSARRVMDRYVERVQSAGDGSMRYKGTDRDGVTFWVAEPHQRTGYHLHALVKLPRRFAKVGRKTKWWFMLNSARRAVGGKPWLNKKGELGLWHRVEVQTYKGYTASEYVAKYVTKTLVDWDVFRIL